MYGENKQRNIKSYSRLNTTRQLYYNEVKKHLYITLTRSGKWQHKAENSRKSQ